MRFLRPIKTAKFWLLLLIFFSSVISKQSFSFSSDPIDSELDFLPSSAIILQYHHVADNTPYSTSTSIDLFKAQMALLKSLDFKVWPLSKIINKLQNKESLPRNVVALTFDDAYSNFYNNAWPILKRYDYPSTIFVATTHIANNPTEFLSWEQLKYLSRHGVEIGSHSDSHNYLARQIYLKNDAQTANQITADLKLSIDKIKQNLGIDTRIFAYPYGEYSDALVKLINQLNLVGFGQHSGPINQHSNFSALPRFPASNQFGSIESLREKLYTVPFNQLSFQPTATFVQINPPKLTLRVADKSLRINCYAPNQGRIPVTKKFFTNFQKLEVRATVPLEKGRSRYNCTAKANGDYFYWFSQPWITL